MKRLFAMLCVLAFSSIAHADYAYGPFMSWGYVDTHHIIVQGSGKYLITAPYCYIYSSSNVKILSDALGPWDGKLMVDGQVCDVQEVSRL